MYRDERDPDLYLGAAAGSIAGGGIGMLAGANRGEQTGHMYLRNLLGTQHSTETLSPKDLAKAREYLKAVKGPNIERNYIQGFSRRGKNKGLMIGALLGAGIGAAINRHSPELTPPAPQVHDVWAEPLKAKVGFWHGFADEIVKLSDMQPRPGPQQHLLPLGQMKRDKLLKSMSYNRNT